MNSPNIKSALRALRAGARALMYKHNAKDKARQFAAACAPHKPTLTLEQAIALVLFRSGCRPSVSTDIADNLTYGWGKLDDYGFWEFQIPGQFME